MFYLAFIYLILLVYIGKNFSNKTRFALAAFPLLLIAIIRFGLGADYFSYEYIYMSLSTMSFLDSLKSFTNIEPIFKLIMYVFVSLKIPYHLFIAITSSFIILVNLKWLMNNCMDNSNRYEMSVLLQFSMLYIYWSLSALRQGIVLVAMLYIFFNGKKEYSIQKKIISTFFFTLIHVSAIIVPIIYIFVELFKFNRKRFILFLLFAPLFKYLFGSAIMKAISLLPLLGKVASYANYNSISFVSMPSLMRLGFIFIIIFYYDELVHRFSNSKKMIDFALLGLIGYFYFPVAMVVGTRTTIFSYALIVILLPMVVSLYKKKSVVVASTVIIMLVSSVSFYNELLKVKDRTGYSGSLLQMNFETIFNGDLQRFSGNSNLFYIKVLEEQYSIYKDNKLNQRVNADYDEAESFYDANLKHEVVKFKNGLYGVLNEEGKVVIIPKYKTRGEIFKNFIMLDQIDGTVSYQVFRILPKDSTQIPVNEHGVYYYSDIKDSIVNAVNDSKTYGMSRYYNKSFDIDIFRNLEYMQKFDLTPVKQVLEYYYEVNPNVKYLRILTTNKSFTVIMKNGELLTSRIYSRVDPFNSNGIAVGYTEYTKEYINSKGEVIWYENIIK